MTTYVRIRQYLAELFLEWDMSGPKDVEEINTH